VADERKCRRAVNSRLHTRIELTRIGRRRTRQDAPIPPEKFDKGQTKEADVFLAARTGPVFGPFSVLGRSRELMLPYIQGDYLRLNLSLGSKLSNHRPCAAESVKNLREFCGGDAVASTRAPDQ